MKNTRWLWLILFLATFGVAYWVFQGRKTANTDGLKVRKAETHDILDGEVPADSDTQYFPNEGGKNSPLDALPPPQPKSPGSESRFQGNELRLEPGGGIGPEGLPPLDEPPPYDPPPYIPPEETLPPSDPSYDNFEPPTGLYEPPPYDPPPTVLDPVNPSDDYFESVPPPGDYPPEDGERFNDDF